MPSSFFNEEYALDLYIHRFPKPVVVIAKGVTMGGGLGLLPVPILCSSTSGVSWRCPKHTSAFSLTWVRPPGCSPSARRISGVSGIKRQSSQRSGVCPSGLANGFVKSRLEKVNEVLTHYHQKLPPERKAAVEQLKSSIASLIETSGPSNPEMDAWVARYFSGKDSVQEIVTSLSQCRIVNELCKEACQRISESSPTSLSSPLSCCVTIKHARLKRRSP